MCVKENYKSEVLLICVFIALLWGAGNTFTAIIIRTKSSGFPLNHWDDLNNMHGCPSGIPALGEQLIYRKRNFI